MPMRDSKPRPIDLMPTIGVGGSGSEEEVVILSAPDSRKPAINAQRRISCAWSGEAV